MSSDSVQSLSNILNATLAFRIYGKLLSPPVEIEAGDRHTVSARGEKLFFVSVRAFAINNFCRTLPAPVLLALPGEGNNPKPGDKCAIPDDRVWQVSPQATTSALVPLHGNVEELISEIELRGIDGGLRLENPRIENGKACVDVHVWAKIKVFGASVGFDERFPICIPLEGCKTVWEIGIARLDICFEAPNRLCGKLCAGKWGIEKCWKECVDLPFASGRSGSDAPACKCAH
jgi:hypothetical protein